MHFFSLPQLNTINVVVFFILYCLLYLFSFLGRYFFHSGGCACLSRQVVLVQSTTKAAFSPLNNVALEWNHPHKHGYQIISEFSRNVSGRKGNQEENCPPHLMLPDLHYFLKPSICMGIYFIFGEGSLECSWTSS